MFKIACDAGHGLYTAGKCMDVAFDPSQTREWVLNDRVARYFAEAAKQYEDVELLRVDDVTGKTDVALPTRCNRANEWDADFYLSFHHNAGAKRTSSGGIVAFSYPGSTTSARYRKTIYNACITAGGLRGNRSAPMANANFYVLKHTNMPAVLMEYGFMDSKIDAPEILKEAYSKKVAYATMEGIAKEKGLKKKTVTSGSSTSSSSSKSSYSMKEFIADIQRSFGAKIDGIAGPETLSKTITVSSKLNNKHSCVYYIQRRLKALGYAEIGKIDGVAGPKFTSAVAHFQMDNDCTVDGEITARAKTWKKLLGLA